MRPTPRARHLVAILIFAGASAAAGYFATLDDRLSSMQINIATVSAKRNQPELFSHDPVFGPSNRWRFHTPGFQTPLEMILVPTGYQDLTLPFRAMTGVVSMIYLCGMYALLYRQSRSWSISAFVAVLSSTIIYTLGRSFWGVGSLSSIVPPTTVLAVVPLIALSYLRYENQWRVMLVFAFVGLCGNIHLVSAMNLMIVLLIVYLVRHRFAPSSLPAAAGCLLCALIGALPYGFYYYTLRFADVPGDIHSNTAAVFQAFRVGGLALMYPDMLKSLLNWGLLVLVLLIPAAAVLSRVERFRVRDLGVWVSFGAGALLVSLVLHGLSQLVGILLGQGPPVIDFAQGANLVMLPLYVLFAQALTNLFRIGRSHRTALRWICAAFIAVWMIPSDNLRVPRHISYELATYFVPEDQKPLRVQQLRTRKLRDAELAAVASWARNNTSRGAVFLIDSAEFRMLSRRSIAACRDDVKYFYYVTPWDLDKWQQRVERQRSVLRSPGGKTSDLAITQFIDKLSKEEFRDVTEWYVILRIKDAPDTPGSLQPIIADAWGDFYRLYRAEQIP